MKKRRMSTATWTEMLRASRCGTHDCAEQDALALTTQLEEVWRNARAAWPLVELSAEAFASHLALHWPEHTPAAVYLTEVCTADLYLACACAAGNAEAVAAFEHHCLDSVDRVLARLRFDPDAIAEVKQRIRFRVLVADDGRPRIVDFSGRGTLRAWVRVMAVREALRIKQRAQRDLCGDDIEQLQEYAAPHIGLEHMKDHYRRAFREAFDRALRELPARDRIMLRQHVLDGLTIDQLGALYHVHRTTAARTLERARRTVLAVTRAHMCTGLDVSSAELDSILRIIRSRLDITLRGLRGRPHH
jgi:RNA polymerase sigma-70 factor (ECF subfamily)